jgi:hypothetical protein
MAGSAPQGKIVVTDNMTNAAWKKMRRLLFWGVESAVLTINKAQKTTV